jgi:hypothetical protein
MTETTPPATSPAADPAPKPKTPAVSRPAFLLSGALVIGLLVEWLIHVPSIGFGHGLAALVAVAGWLFIGRGLRLRASLSGVLMLVYVAGLGVLTALRDSATLEWINILAGLTLLLLAAVIYLPGRLHQLSLSRYLSEGFLSAVAALGEPFVLLFSDMPAARAAAPAGKRGLGAAVGGIFLALPLLLLFGGLFYAADAVFAGYVKDIFRDIDLGVILSHLFLWAWVAWLVAGGLHHAFTRRGDNTAAAALKLSRPAGLRIGNTQGIIVLASLNILFLAFVLVQAVYLFGGVDTLQRAGMTYSEYARKGFFELVSVAALVLTLVLALDWLTWPRAGAGGKFVNVLNGLLIVFTFVIMASAVQRMLLYQRTYGMTELRLYTTAFMGWLAVVLFWLIVTVLLRTDGEKSSAGRRLFAFGALIAGMALILVLNILNPDALIARTNLARSVAGVGEELDVKYLTTQLSADAIPVLAAGMPTLSDPCLRAELARGLIDKHGRMAAQYRKSGWRGITYSQIRAAQTLQSWQDVLRQYAATCQ